MFSSETLQELLDVISRDKFDRFITFQERVEFVRNLSRIASIVESTVTITACRDEKDNKFLELAVSGEATHIITGDNDLLVLHPFEGIAIVTPAAFLEMSTSDDGE